MQIETIHMDRDKAKLAFEQYRDAAKQSRDDEDIALAAGYQALAKGQPVLHLHNVMEAAGADERGRPKLAITPADARWCWFSCDWRNGWSWCFHPTMSRDVRPNARVTSRTVVVPAPVRSRHAVQARAVVPRVPPEHRPKAHARNYHVLWEAEWETVPVDPLLLKHIGGPLYVVLAQWDLTELEQAVLSDRFR